MERMAKITVTKGGKSAISDVIVNNKSQSVADVPLKSSEQKNHKNGGRTARLKSLLFKRRLVVFGGLAALLLLVGIGAAFYFQTQRHVVMSFTGREQGFAVNDTISVQFNQSLKSVDLEIQPKLEGFWRFQKNVFGITAAHFEPADVKLESATQYEVRLVDARRALTKKTVGEKKTSFVTEFAPGIISVSPLPGSKDVKPSEKLEIVFTDPKSDNEMPSLKLEPAVQLEESVSSDKKTYTWKPKGGLAQSTHYAMTINNSKDEKLANIGFDTVLQPNITTATNKTHFYPEEKIEVGFDIPMNTSRPAITCECEGEGVWEGTQKFVFTPTEIQPGKSYPYTVQKGLESAVGGVREIDQSYAIQTPGAVVASVSGSKSAPLQTNATIRFDQAVKRETLQPRLSVEPHVATQLSWKDDKTAIVQLSGLDYQTTYTIKVAPGVEPARFGLTSTAIQAGSIVTAPQTIKLNVPRYRQSYSLSCEETALRMALAYRGVHASDMEILQRVGYNPKPYDGASNSWDNPYEQFVGDVNGSQVRKTGYGVYAPPIAKAARSYGRGATVATGVSANFLAQAIHDGNPAVIWGTTSGGQRMDWNTSSGPVGSWVGQHARTLVGVAGKPSAPIGFWVNDPINGSHKYWTAGALISHMNQHGNLSNQAVVVH